MPLDKGSVYDPIVVHDHLKFGQLMMKWALDPKGPPKEMTMEQFKKAIIEFAGVKNVEEVIHIPKEAPKKVRFVQGDEYTMVINLSPAAMMRQAIQEGSVSGEYPLPQFYTHILDGVIREFDEIFPRRVGDYTIAGCR